MRPPGPTPRVGPAPTPGGGYSLRPHAAATGSRSTGGGAAAAAAAAVAGNDSAGHGDAVAPAYPRSAHEKSSDRVVIACVCSGRDHTEKLELEYTLISQARASQHCSRTLSDATGWSYSPSG